MKKNASDNQSAPLSSSNYFQVEGIEFPRGLSAAEIVDAAKPVLDQYSHSSWFEDPKDHGKGLGFVMDLGNLVAVGHLDSTHSNHESIYFDDAYAAKSEYRSVTSSYLPKPPNRGGPGGADAAIRAEFEKDAIRAKLNEAFRKCLTCKGAQDQKGGDKTQPTPKSTSWIVKTGLTGLTKDGAQALINDVVGPKGQFPIAGGDAATANIEALADPGQFRVSNVQTLSGGLVDKEVAQNAVSAAFNRVLDTGKYKEFVRPNP
jgi:hypothetical protein